MLKKELKLIRLKNGLTQKDVGDFLNMGNTNYCKKENGKIDFTLSEIMTLKEKFKLSQKDVDRIFFTVEVDSKATNSA